MEANQMENITKINETIKRIQKREIEFFSKTAKDLRKKVILICLVLVLINIFLFTRMYFMLGTYIEPNTSDENLFIFFMVSSISFFVFFIISSVELYPFLLSRVKKRFIKTEEYKKTVLQEITDDLSEIVDLQNKDQILGLFSQLTKINGDTNNLIAIFKKIGIEVKKVFKCYSVDIYEFKLSGSKIEVEVFSWESIYGTS